MKRFWAASVPAISANPSKKATMSVVFRTVPAFLEMLTLIRSVRNRQMKLATAG